MQITFLNVRKKYTRKKMLGKLWTCPDILAIYIQRFTTDETCNQLWLGKLKKFQLSSLLLLFLSGQYNQATPPSIPPMPLQVHQYPEERNVRFPTPRTMAKGQFTNPTRPVWRKRNKILAKKMTVWFFYYFFHFEKLFKQYFHVWPW